MHDEQPLDRGAWVVLGGVHLLNRTAPRRPDEPIVLAGPALRGLVGTEAAPGLVALRFAVGPSRICLSA